MLSNIRNLIQSYNPENFDFSDLEIACSFDPLHQIFFEKEIDPMEVLIYIYKELKIDDIRLGIRWNKDLDFYKQYLDYCLENNIKVILNVGPLKVMRWPEEHIPEEFKSLLKKGDVINLKHPIVKPSLEYLENILQKLNYKNIVAIQPDNELFNPFGEYSLRITKEFELKVIKVILKYFPKTPIYFNSSGINDFKQIFDLTKDLGDIILGVNYYYKTQFQHWIPIINKLDNLILKKPFSISSGEFKNIAEQRGFQVEVSELQGEPWWPNALTPGNNFEEFQFSLNRTKFLKPNGQQKIIVRYWGIEDFVSKFLLETEVPENIKIKELILKIQS